MRYLSIMSAMSNNSKKETKYDVNKEFLYLLKIGSALGNDDLCS